MVSDAITLVPPSQPVLTQEEVMTFLRLDGDAGAIEAANLAAAALDDVESTSGLRLIDQTVEVRADRFADLAVLSIGPIGTVLAIRYRDPAGQEQLLDEAVYELVGAGLRRGIEVAPDQAWPQALPRPGAIRVTLTVGYGATAAQVPPQLRYAVFSALRAKAEERDIDLAAMLVNHRIWG